MAGNSTVLGESFNNLRSRFFRLNKIRGQHRKFCALAARQIDNSLPEGIVVIFQRTAQNNGNAWIYCRLYCLVIRTFGYGLGCKLRIGRSLGLRPSPLNATGISTAVSNKAPNTESLREAATTEICFDCFIISLG